MEFSAFFDKLKIENTFNCSATDLLGKYKNECTTDNDFIQLYELQDIIDVVDVFSCLSFFTSLSFV